MPEYLALAYRRALSNADPSLVQLSFDAGVIERYRGRQDYSVIRTNTAGRVKKQGGWSIDFGITEGDGIIHASWRALATQLPEDERDHWATHAAGTHSENFLRMQLAPGSCFDDGDVRAW
jgi:hypothetical protein